MGVYLVAILVVVVPVGVFLGSLEVRGGRAVAAGLGGRDPRLDAHRRRMGHRPRAVRAEPRSAASSSPSSPSRCSRSPGSRSSTSCSPPRGAPSPCASAAVSAGSPCSPEPPEEPSPPAACRTAARPPLPRQPRHRAHRRRRVDGAAAGRRGAVRTRRPAARADHGAVLRMAPRTTTSPTTPPLCGCTSPAACARPRPHRTSRAGAADQHPGAGHHAAARDCRARPLGGVPGHGRRVRRALPRGLGLSSISSVLAPYAVSRPGDSPFQQPQRTDRRGRGAGAGHGRSDRHRGSCGVAHLAGDRGQTIDSLFALWIGVGAGAFVLIGVSPSERCCSNAAEPGSWSSPKPPEREADRAVGALRGYTG